MVNATALSGKRDRQTLFTYPIYSYEIPFSMLRSDSVNLEWQQLMGFINSLYGGVLLFGYSDPDDNAVTNQEFGVGDGKTTGPFQLVRALGNFVEPVFLINGAPAVEVAGTPTTAFTLDSYGRITFNSPPANGAALTWSGSYYMPCRLDDDTTNFSKFLNQFFELPKLRFSTEKLP